MAQQLDPTSSFDSSSKEIGDCSSDAEFCGGHFLPERSGVVFKASSACIRALSSAKKP